MSARAIRTCCMSFAWGAMVVAWWQAGSAPAALCAAVGMIGEIIGAGE